MASWVVGRIEFAVISCLPLLWACLGVALDRSRQCAGMDVSIDA